MNSEKCKRICCIIYNIFFAASFIYLDFRIIESCYQDMIWSSAHDDIFGAAFLPFVDFIIFAPLFASQLLLLSGTNTLFRRQLRGGTKFCVLLSTVLSGLTVLAYIFNGIAMTTEIYLGNVMNWFNHDTALTIAWISAILSSVLFIVGRIRACVGVYMDIA